MSVSPRRPVFLPVSHLDAAGTREKEIAAQEEEMEVAAYPRWRHAIHRLVHLAWFDRFIYFVIFLNTLTICTANIAVFVHHQSTINMFEAIFIIIFMIEMILKMLGLGMRRYFQSNWNTFDCIVVLVSFFGMIQPLIISSHDPGVEVSSAIAVRMLRPLRALSTNDSMRRILGALAASWKHLLDVIYLTVGFLFLMTLLGLDFYKGTQSHRCYDAAAATKFINTSEQIPWSGDGQSVCALSGLITPMDPKLLTILGTRGFVVNRTALPPSSNGEKICEYGKYCLPTPAPLRGFQNLDNFLTAGVTIYGLVVLEGWSFVIYYMIDSDGWWSVLFAIVIIAIGNCFVFNLMLATLVDSFQAASAIDQARLDATSVDNRQHTSFIPGPLQFLLSLGSSDPENESENPKERGLCSRISHAGSHLRHFVHEKVTSTNWFNYTIVTVASINLLTMGFVHHGMPSTVAHISEYTNFTCTVLFTIEMILMFIAEPLREIIKHPLHVFDSIVTIAAVVELLETGEGQLSILRSLHCMKVLTLSQSVKRTIHTLFTALRDTAGLLFLWAMALFLLALLGMQLHAQKMCGLGAGFNDSPNTTVCDNVPRANFDNIGYALTTVFVTIAGDNWRTMQSLGQASIGAWSALFFCTTHLIGGFVLLNLFIAVLVNTKDRSEDPEPATDGTEMQPMSNTPPSEPAQAVVAVGDTDDLSKGLLVKAKQPDDPGALQRDDTSDFIDFLRQKRLTESNFLVRISGRIAESPVTTWFVIIATGALMCSEALQRPSYPPDHGIQQITFYTDILAIVAFTLDVLTKLMYLGAWTSQDRRSVQPPGYFQSSWNSFDFFITLVSWMAVIASFIPGASSIAQWLRVPRALRALSFIGRSARLKIVFRSLVRSLPELRNGLLIIAFAWVILAILGVQFFSGMFGACTKVSWGDATFGPPFIKEKEACVEENYTWISNPQHNFDNAGHAMLALFEVFSISNWEHIMYIGSDTVGEDIAPTIVMNRAWVPLYFIGVMVVCTFFLLGYLKSAMIDAYFRTEKEIEAAEMSKVKKDADFMGPEQADFFAMYRRALFFMKPPLHVTYGKDSYRHQVRRFVRHSFFERGLFILVVVHIVLESLVHVWSNLDFTLLVLDLFFNLAFLVALLLKFIAYGIVPFFSQARNSTDLVISIIALTGVTLQFATGSTAATKILRLFRVTRIYRVFFVSTGIMLILRTVVDSAKQFSAVLILLFLLFYCYAILGFRLFGSVKWDPTSRYGLTRYANYESFGIAMFTLLRLMTVDDWQLIMWNCAIAPPHCDPNIGECGSSKFLSYFYHMSFVILSNWIGLRLFTAVLLGSFSAAEKVERYAIQERHVREFRNLWKKHTSEEQNHAFMTLAQLEDFLRELPKPIGFDWSEYDEKIVQQKDCEPFPPSDVVRRHIAMLPVTAHTNLITQQAIFDALVRFHFGVPLPPSAEEEIEKLLEKRFRQSHLQRIQKETAGVGVPIRVIMTVVALQRKVRARRAPNGSQNGVQPAPSTASQPAPSTASQLADGKNEMNDTAAVNPDDEKLESQ